jgi:hypothetical protein
MHTIVARNVPESDMRHLREEAASRKISVNDLLLILIREYAERYRMEKTRGKAA